MNRNLRSEPGLMAPFAEANTNVAEANTNALEGFVSIVSRSAGVVLLVAALGVIAANIIF